MFDFLNYGFMVRALIAGVLIALAAPTLGIFLVARRSSLLTDTLSHTALAGVGLGILTGFHPLLRALLISILAANGIEKIITKGKLSTEAVHALFLSGGLAVAVFLMSLSQTPVSFESYLFGSIATVSASDLWLLGGTTLIIVLTVLTFWWPLVTLALSEELAEASGVQITSVKVGLAVLAALTVSLSLKIVGGLLIGALIVVPVLSAMQVSRSFRSTLFIAIAFAEAAALIGLFLSYTFNIPSGSAIVLMSLLGFLFALANRQAKK